MRCLIAVCRVWVILGILSLVGSGHAWGQTWTGGAADDKWSSAANWDLGVPTTNGTADVVLAGNTHLASNIDASTWTLKSLAFGISAGAFTISGGQLVVPSIVNNSTATQTFNNSISGSNIALSATGGELRFNGAITSSSGTVTIDCLSRITTAAPITGASRINKTGPGEWIIDGASVNPAFGVSVAGGTLILKNTSGPAITGSLGGLKIGESGSGLVRFEADQQVSDASELWVFPNGVLDLNGFSEQVGDLTMQAGIITGGQLALKKGVTFSGGTVPSLIRCPINLNGQFRVFKSEWTNTIGEISGVISNGGITANGVGIVRLLAANTYAAGTNLISGEISVGNDAALGTGDVLVSGASGARLSAYGATRTVANPIRLYTSLQIAGTYDLVLSGGITLGNNTTLTVDSNTTTSQPPLSRRGSRAASTRPATAPCCWRPTTRSRAD